MSPLRVKNPPAHLLPPSLDAAARLLPRVRSTRPLALPGVNLPQGLRPAHRVASNPAASPLSEAQLRVRGKGNKLRFLPLAPETVQLLDHYLRLERPNPCSAALFVSLKGPARGRRMTLAGLRSLFRYHPASPASSSPTRIAS